MKRCLGIDCGEHTGVGIVDQPREFVHAELVRCWNTKHDSYGLRFLLFEKRIRALIEEYKPDLVAYEIWRSHKGTQAAQVLGGYLATLTKILAEPGMPPGIGLDVQDIKFHATGSRLATKDKMIAAANILWPKARIISPDVADALHMARRGLMKVF